MDLLSAQEAFIIAKKIVRLVVALAVSCGSATLFAQEGTKPANLGEGTVMVNGKNYPLKNAVAYETTIDGEDGIAVVLSGPTISSEKVNEGRKSEKKGEPSDFRRPYVKLEFTKTGEFKGWGAGAGDVSLGRRTGGTATGEIKLQDGRVVGKASQPNETSGLDVRFDVPLLRAGESLPPSKKPGPAANVKPTVTGIFKGNGKDAKLAYMSAHWREPFGDKPSIAGWEVCSTCQAGSLSYFDGCDILGHRWICWEHAVDSTAAGVRTDGMRDSGKSGIHESWRIGEGSRRVRNHH